MLSRPQESLLSYLYDPLLRPFSPGNPTALGGCQGDTHWGSPSHTAMFNSQTSNAYTYFPQPYQSSNLCSQLSPDLDPSFIFQPLPPNCSSFYPARAQDNIFPLPTIHGGPVTNHFQPLGGSLTSAGFDSRSVNPGVTAEAIAPRTTSDLTVVTTSPPPNNLEGCTANAGSLPAPDAPPNKPETTTMSTGSLPPIASPSSPSDNPGAATISTLSLSAMKNESQKRKRATPGTISNPSSADSMAETPTDLASKKTKKNGAKIAGGVPTARKSSRQAKEPSRGPKTLVDPNNPPPHGK